MKVKKYNRLIDSIIKPNKEVWPLDFITFLLFIFFLYRIILCLVTPNSFKEIQTVLFNGLRYDIRWVFMLSVPLVFLSLLDYKDKKKAINNLKNFYFHIALGCVWIFFIADYYYYQYTSSRLSFTLTELFLSFKSTFDIINESFSGIKLLFFIIGLHLSTYYLIWRFCTIHKFFNIRLTITKIAFIIICMIAGIWGSLSKYPLTWSKAYNETSFGQLALNPMESFFYGMFFYENKDSFTITKRDMRIYENQFYTDTSRIARNTNHIQKLQQNNSAPLNVVLIIAESLSSYKTSLTLNELNPTPELNEIKDKAFYFPNCYAPHYGTARAVWNIFTGIPDLNWKYLSTHSIPGRDFPSSLNHIPFKNKYFIMGGNAGWGDIRGFLSHSVNDIKILDESSFEEKASSVWGLDDYVLFQKAHELFQNKTEPFFACILTSGNHIPYSIPENSSQYGFKKMNISDHQVRKYGFNSVEEFNSLRYLDFCIGHFLKWESTNNYGDNTVFVIVGDHGTTGTRTIKYPEIWHKNGISLIQVPLLFYKKNTPTGITDSALVSLSDIMPSVAALKNSTVKHARGGINIFGDILKKGQLYMLHDRKEIGWISKEERYTLVPYGLLSNYSNRNGEGKENDTQRIISVKNYYKKMYGEGYH